MSDRNNRSKASQAKFRLSAKKALIERGLSVTRLAQVIGRPRNTVSMSINRGVFPRVRQLIASELSITA